MLMFDFALNHVGKNAFVERDSLARKKRRKQIHQPSGPTSVSKTPRILAPLKYNPDTMTCPSAAYASAPIRPRRTA
jgi:hypothetical protein